MPYEGPSGTPRVDPAEATALTEALASLEQNRLSKEEHDHLELTVEGTPVTIVWKSDSELTVYVENRVFEVDTSREAVKILESTQTNTDDNDDDSERVRLKGIVQQAIGHLSDATNRTQP